MRKLKLVPVAARVHFAVPEGAAVPDWATVLRAFVGAAADEASRIPLCVIGHIKGIVRSGDSLVHVHSVSTAVPVEVAGKLPPDAREITLELVLLVYGLTAQAAAGVLEKAGARTTHKHGCSVTCAIAPAEDGAAHPAGGR